MAFSQFTLLRGLNGKPRGSFSIYTYSSDDNLATVIGTDYFIQSRLDLDPDDIIYAQLGDGFTMLEMVTDTTAAAV